MTDSESQSAEIHQHSGMADPPWASLLVILALCGMLLLYYLQRPLPAAFRDNGPTTDSTSVALTVRGTRLSVPANYLETRGARRGGDQDVVALFALLPDMRGYSAAEATLFSGNAADSPLLHMAIRGDTNSLDPASRLSRIYMPYILNPKGTQGPFGLTRYDFRADSGYGRDDLFVGPGDPMLLLLCERPAQDLPSPNCLAIDRPIARNVNLSYRFKRAQLARWQQISEGVGRLVGGFLETLAAIKVFDASAPGQKMMQLQSQGGKKQQSRDQGQGQHPFPRQVPWRMAAISVAPRPAKTAGMI